MYTTQGIHVDRGLEGGQTSFDILHLRHRRNTCLEWSLRRHRIRPSPGGAGVNQ